MENNRRTRLLNVARTSFQLRPFDPLVPRSRGIFIAAGESREGWVAVSQQMENNAGRSADG